ncbi:MAG: beta-hexosaminidase precursor [Paenibacillus sp.]|nr:beta-hexosaminidase precursor [Paenibacillus sp.]
MQDNDPRLWLADESGIRFSLYRKPAQAGEFFLEPVDELIYHLRASLGTDVTEQDASFPVKLTVHMDYRSGLEREEFEIIAREAELTLRAATLQGMFHAVYYFLEKTFGIRWLWPGKTGEVIPRQSKVSVAYGTVREKPDFAWRAIWIGGAIHGMTDYHTALRSIMNLPISRKAEFDTWCRRNRLGGLNVADGHRWSEIAPAEEFGEKQPELYALVDGNRHNIPVDGKHGNQPCLTYPNTRKLMLEYACARFAAQPDLDVFSIALNDGGASCECPACLAFDQEAQSERSQAPEHFDAVTRETAEENDGRHASEPISLQRRSITDRVVWQANQVANELKCRFPHKMLLILLYSRFRRAPVTYRLDERVIGQFCIMGNMFWSEDIRKLEMQRLQEMGQCMPQLGIYEYYANGAWPDIHRLFPELVETTVRDYYRAGARFFATQPSEGFATNGLNFYILSRMLWDVDAQAEEVAADFCSSGFAAAAGSIRAFFQAFADRWRETGSGLKLAAVPESRLAYAELYDEAFLRRRRQELDRARKEAAADASVLERIEFLQSGLEYTRLYCQALQATLQVYRSCGASRFAELQQSVIPADRLRHALKSWEDYWSFVKQNEGNYIFGDFWVHYRPGKYGAKDETLALLREKMQQTRQARKATEV